MISKIVSLEKLAEIVNSNKSDSKTIVHCHGVFDLLHIGHIKHFQEAKSLGDLLIVTLTQDEFVNKGPGRPAFPAELRLEAIAALESVDYVALNHWASAEKAIELLKPSIYFKGPDYRNNKDDVTGKIKKEIEAVEGVGGKIKYSTEVTFSSSSLLNKYGDVYSESQKDFISSVSTNINPSEVGNLLETLKELKVLLIGETIVDEYVFCEALGKSGKEPVLALRNILTEQYLGGTAAVANHLANFCDSVTLISALGELREYEEFVDKNLAKNIKADFISKDNSPTILKKRFVDHLTNTKTLGVYSINDENLSPNNEKDFRAIIEKKISTCDLVIVTDYGHGLISETTAKWISDKAPYIALNAQINAANRGYHTLNKYNKVDCVIINEGELRHELRSRDGDLKDLMTNLSEEMQTKSLVVTRGNQGATLYNSVAKKFITCPAFASKVVDKIGSGDAMLALLSASLRAGYDESFSLLIGSLAAAQSVETISNSKSVNKETMLKTIQHLLK